MVTVAFPQVLLSGRTYDLILFRISNRLWASIMPIINRMEVTVISVAGIRLIVWNTLSVFASL